MNLLIRPYKEMGADHAISVSMFDQQSIAISDSMISVMMRSIEIFAHANRTVQPSRCRQR
jgi:fructoselysine-6-P-deglycase FrlB-like protein